MAAVGWLQARFREGHVWAREAGALLERMGGNELLEASLLAMLGNVDHKEGHYDEALEHLRRALAIQERAYGPWDPRVADASRGVSVALYRAARYAEAEAPARRALEIRARVLGAHHPDTGDAHAGLASVLNLLGRFDEAVAHFKEAIAILEAIHGADGLYLAIPLHNLGNVYLERDRPEEALAYYRREADALRELGRAAEARSEYQRVLGVFERGLGAEHPFVAYPLTGLGRAELTLGRPEQAIVPLERALAVRAKRADPAELAETRFFLGRALWEAGRDRGRGRALVAQAADDYATAGAQASLRVHREGAEARAWLGRRGGEVR